MSEETTTEKQVLKAESGPEETWEPYSLESILEDPTRNRQRHVAGLGNVRFKCLTNSEISGLGKLQPWTQRDVAILKAGLRALNPGITGGELLDLSQGVRDQVLDAVKSSSGLLGDDPVKSMSEWIAGDARAQLVGLACREFHYSLEAASKLTHGQLVFLAAWLLWYTKK
jgi:hypothetical protein